MIEQDVIRDLISEAITRITEAIDISVINNLPLQVKSLCKTRTLLNNALEELDNI